MSIFEVWSLMLGVATVLLNAALFYIFFRQMRLLARQLDAATESTRLDHERRRLTETFEFANEILEKQWEFASMIPDARDGDAVKNYLASTTDSSPPHDVVATRYLDIYENLAAAVNVGVLDIEMVDRLEGGRIVRTWDAFAPWVEERRQRLGQESLFVELQQLADKVRNLPP